MSRIRSENSKPEARLRKSLHGLGFRYRKNDGRLPGKPDIVLPKFRTVIFVNGCFWHQHPNCPRATLPKSNIDYWHNKLRKNTERDNKNIEKLEQLGWSVLVIWECEIQKNLQNVTFYICQKLNGNKC